MLFVFEARVTVLFVISAPGPDVTAQDALRNVLNKAGVSTYGIEALEDDVYDINNEKQNDPLMNIEVRSGGMKVNGIPRQPVSSSSVENLSQFGSPRGKQFSSRRTANQNGSLRNGGHHKSKSRTAELLDNILNSDDLVEASTSPVLKTSCDMSRNRSYQNIAQSHWDRVQSNMDSLHVTSADPVPNSLSTDSGFSSQSFQPDPSLLEHVERDAEPVSPGVTKATERYKRRASQQANTPPPQRLRHKRSVSDFGVRKQTVSVPAHLQDMGGGGQRPKSPGSLSCSLPGI